MTRPMALAAVIVVCVAAVGLVAVHVSAATADELAAKLRALDRELSFATGESFLDLPTDPSFSPVRLTRNTEVWEQVLQLSQAEGGSMKARLGRETDRERGERFARIALAHAALGQSSQALRYCDLAKGEGQWGLADLVEARVMYDSGDLDQALQLAREVADARPRYLAQYYLDGYVAYYEAAAAVEAKQLVGARQRLEFARQRLGAQLINTALAEDDRMDAVNGD